MAYDIADQRRRTRVFRMLRDWRLGGQKSIHECLLSNRQAEDLFAQISLELDPESDKLLLAWLEGHRSVLLRGVATRSGKDDHLWILG